MATLDDEKNGHSRTNTTPSFPDNSSRLMSPDEYHLGTLGYRQVFVRGLGMFENWAATFTTMNFVSGIPSLFYFAINTGGPKAMISNCLYLHRF